MNRHLIPHRLRTTPAVLVCIVVNATMLFAQVPLPPQGEPPPPPEAAPAAPPQGEAPAEDVTPPRLSFTHGAVSFWRPGAEDWTPAAINTALAPGDGLYTGPNASLEIQVGARAYVRAGENTQLGIETHEPDFLQLKVTAGHASLDLRTLSSGHTVELDTPNAAYTIEATGYYRIDIADETTTFITRRGGSAIMTPAGGEAVSIAPSEEVVVQGTDTPSVGTYAAPDLDGWDRWNYQRTDHLIDAVSNRYVPQDVYGTDDLDHYGNWRVTGDYGPVWVPDVGPDWAPYTAGRWMWDADYGWTWLDDAPWGWAPCHYGRWVHAGGYWAWAPGPLIARPVYAPALVAFFGGPHFGVSIGIGAPALGWVALGWGEPLIPWWGRPGFIGVPGWHGWGGPHVVNNVVIERTTVVNVRNINVYQNANVRNAVVAMREDHFGRGMGDRVRVHGVDPHQFEPVQGRLPVKPVAASLTPHAGHALQPPERIVARSVVATRAPHDGGAALRAEGLPAASHPAPAPRIVSSPHAPHAPAAPSRAPFGQQGTVERARPGFPPQYQAPRSSQPQHLESPGARPAQPHAARPAPPERPAPPVHAPAPAAQPRVAPAPRPQPAPETLERRMPAQPRDLPGEPANRLYRQPHQPRAPQANVPAAVRPNAGGGRNSGQQRRR